jgi:hypothetical protein
LCGTDGDASMYGLSLRSVSSNASMLSVNPGGASDGLYASRSSNISLQSLSSNVSMTAGGPGDWSYGADRDASTYASSNMSLHSASSNASMRSIQNFYPPKTHTHASRSKASEKHMAVGKTSFFFDILPFF